MGTQSRWTVPNIMLAKKNLTLGEKCPNAEIRTRKNFAFGYFSRSEAIGRMVIGSSILTKKKPFSRLALFKWHYPIKNIKKIQITG